MAHLRMTHSMSIVRSMYLESSKLEQSTEHRSCVSIFTKYFVRNIFCFYEHVLNNFRPIYE